MKMEILKELLKGPKAFSSNSPVAPILEELFWDGCCEFKGNVAIITPLGEQRLKEL